MIQHIAHNSLMPFYLSNQLGTAGGNYNLCFSYRLHRKEDAELVTKKIEELTNIKAYLRQTFSIIDEKLTTNFHDYLPPEVTFYNCSLHSLSHLELKLINETHNLNECSPIKINFITLSDDQGYIILINIHHIVMDGVTLDQFLVDLNDLIANEPVTIESIDYYLEQLNQETPLREETCDDNLAAYLSTTAQTASAIEFHIDNTQHEALHYNAVLPPNIAEHLTLFSEQNLISKFNVLLLAYEIFLAKIFDQKQMLVAYPINIRKNKKINGCFLNVIDLPVVFSKSSTFLTLIKELETLFPTLKIATKHKLVKPNFGRLPLFSALTVAQLQDLCINKEMFRASSYPQITYANISLKYREQQGQFHFVCDVIDGLFPEYFSSTLLSRFFHFLEKILLNPELHMENVNFLLNGERQKIASDFNQNDMITADQGKTLHQLFQEQAERTPDLLAVVSHNQKITYRELHEKSNQLARYIEESFKDVTTKRITADTLIPIFVNRDIDMVIAILGVLKTGAAYVPIDSEFTDQRIKYILLDIESVLLLTQSTFQDRIKKITQNVKIINLDHDQYHCQAKSNIVSKSNVTNLAYVIYTSGTTGTPKGVMIEHRSVVNTLSSLYKIYQIEVNRRGTAYTGYGFDVSVAEIFTVLTRGGELHLLSHERKDINKLATYLNEEKINITYLPPAILSILPKIEYPNLKIIMFAGEPCNQATGQYWLKKHTLYNCYGPTEACIYATYKLVDARNINEIGKPLENTTAYVLDSDHNMVCIGLIGELYLGGCGLARGYLNQTKLTSDKFIQNPFQTNQEKAHGKNQRLYKTGDLVRWLPDGNLEYIGRNDFQVKILGHRIELREIEETMREVDGIEQALVVVFDRDDQNKFLCAYYTAKEKISINKITDTLADRLPHYMIPAYFVWLEKFPLNASGKIERKLLPQPDLNYLAIEYVAPATVQEDLVCKAFAYVLGLQKIGVLADFFRMGGNSLKAIHLLSTLQNNFNIKMADIFNLRNPREIARAVKFEQNNFYERLKKNMLSQQLHNSQIELDTSQKSKLYAYTQSIQTVPTVFTNKSIRTVLLTGSAGFLGCNLLKELLESTNYSIILLIRSETMDKAFSKLNKRFKLYFNQSLDHESFNSRVLLYLADIEKNNLGLTLTDYQMIATRTDSIIHAAACVKHYGEYNQFHSANVQGTINLLELAKLTKFKDFHYISTISIFTDQAVLTEDDRSIREVKEFNNYIKTKAEGEEAVISYRAKGINSNIYRLGNLAFIFTNGRTQENKEDNGFLNRMKCFAKLGIITHSFTMEEISPVDLTAQAVIKLFDKKELNNTIFHVVNPYLYDLEKFFEHHKEYSVKNVSIENFIQTINERLKNSNEQQWIERFLLHQGWLDDVVTYTSAVKVLQNRTEATLARLNFEWPPITDRVFLRYFKKMISI